MTKELKDVIYAGFAQMSYLSWMRIPEGTSVMDALFDDKWFKKLPDVVNVKSRCLFACYTEDADYQVPIWEKDFDDWELYYSANDLKLMSDLFGSGLIKSGVSKLDLNAEDYKTSNGFYATAFINRKTNQVLIAYRGTDDIADKLTDIDICLLNKYNPQLVCTHWFLRHVQWKLSQDKIKAYIYFTGHSLGGALAQFAHIINNDNSKKSVTWNALGIGVYFIDHFDDEGLINNLTIDICRNTSVRYGVDLINFIKSVWKSGEVLTNTGKIYDDVYSFLIRSNVKNTSNLFNLDIGVNISFGFKYNNYDDRALTKDKCNIEKIKMATMELVGMLKSIALFKKGMTYSKNISDFNIINYVFPDDWTVNLQTKIGKIIDVTKKDDYYIKEIVDDSALRVIKQTFKRFGFIKHSVGNFLMYMNDNGDIIPGHIRNIFIEVLLAHMLEYCIEEQGFTKYILKKIGNYEYRVKSTEYFTPDRLLLYGENSINNLSHKEQFKEAIRNYIPRYINNMLVYGGYNNMYMNGIIGDSAIVLGE